MGRGVWPAYHLGAMVISGPGSFLSSGPAANVACVDDCGSCYHSQKDKSEKSWPHTSLSATLALPLSHYSTGESGS